MDFSAWSIKFNAPIFARQRCPPFNVLTLDEVWSECNAASQLASQPCGLPIKFTCGGYSASDAWNLNAVSSGKAASNPLLIYGAPVDAPFVHALTVLPQVPVYDIANIKQMTRHNDTINLFALRDLVSGEVHTVSNPSAVFNSTQLESCGNGVVSIGGDCPDCLYDFVSSENSNIPINVVSTFSTPISRPCLVNDVASYESALALTLDKINNASTKAEFIKSVNTLNLVKNYDAFVGCNAIIDTLTTTSSAALTVFGGRNCEADPSSAQWQLDPCCNYQLQFFQCCAEQTLSVQINVLSGIQYTIINATVPQDSASTWQMPVPLIDPATNLTVMYPSDTGYVASPARQAVLDSVVSILDQHIQTEGVIQDTSDGCEAKLKSTIPPNYLATALGFVSKCQDIIYNTKTTTGKGKCAADSDCYTTCNRNSHQCTPPTTGDNGNLDDAFARCTVDKVRPEVLLYIRDLLNVPSLPTDTGPLGLGFNTRMALALTEAVTSYDCDGPTDYSDGACLIDIPDSECENPSFGLDPSGVSGNGLTLSQAVRWTSSDATQTAMVWTFPEFHDGYNVQYYFIIVRTDIHDEQSCLQLLPGSQYIEWVNVSMNGGQGYDFLGNLIPPVYTQSVCRIIMPQLPDLNAPIQAPPPLSINMTCDDYSTPDPVTGLCADGTMPGTAPTMPSYQPTCYDGSEPNNVTGLCADGEPVYWFPTNCPDGTLPNSNGICDSANQSASSPIMSTGSGSIAGSESGTSSEGELRVNSGIGEGSGSGSSSDKEAGTEDASRSVDTGDFSSASSRSNSSFQRSFKVPVERRHVGTRRGFTCSSGRRASDPCSSITDPMAQYTCLLQTHFLFLCNGLPDMELFFDPQTSICATITSAFPALGVVNHNLPGVGRCKVQNFGVTPNGLLPFGYMTDDSSGNPQIDWRSPLNYYLDSTQSPVSISTSGASIAETRCQQTAVALNALGVQANLKSSLFYRYKTVTVIGYDPVIDSFSEQTFAGNKTMCELEKKCNSDTVAAIAAGTALDVIQCTAANSTKSVSFIQSFCFLNLFSDLYFISERVLWSPP